MVGQRKRRVNSTCEETVPGRFGLAMHVGSMLLAFQVPHGNLKLVNACVMRYTSRE